MHDRKQLYSFGPQKKNTLELIAFEYISISTFYVLKDAVAALPLDKKVGVLDRVRERTHKRALPENGKMLWVKEQLISIFIRYGAAGERGGEEQI